MEEITLSCQYDDGDPFDFDVELPEDLMIRPMWWIDSHGHTLTV